MKGEQNHPAIHAIDHIGISQGFIPAVHIGKSVTEFDLWGKDEVREEKLKSNSSFHTLIGFVHLHHVVCIAGT